MPGGVELVHRADQAHPEDGLDLGGLAGLQEPVEALEDLHILPPGRRRPPRHCQLPDDPVDILWGHLPRWAAQRRQGPLQQAGVVVDGHRAEPARLPGGHERLDTLGLERPRVGGDRLLRDGPALQHAQS
jgi:hypothetical protein